MSVGQLAAAAPASADPGATAHLRRRVIVAVVVAATLTAALALFLLVTTPDQGADDDGGWRVHLVSDLFAIGVGLVAWQARPGNRVGPLFILWGFADTISFLSLSHSVVWTIGDMWNTAGVVVLANIYLVFPAGRSSGWSRRLVVACYGWFFAVSIGRRLFLDYPWAGPPRNPFLVWPNDGLADALGQIGNVGAVILVVLVIGTVLDRWRRGSPAARRALAPVFWVSPIALVVDGSYFLGQAIGSDALVAASTGVLAQLSGYLLPVAFLVGLLRTRLERASIADLVRQLDGVSTGELEGALARAIHDPTLRLAFPNPSASGYVDSAGLPIEVPGHEDARSSTHVMAADRTIAILIHDPAVDRDLVESAAAASRLALENERLAAELRAQLEEVRASRLRIVEATDEERRRLERDLHDGAQQRLVALGFTLRRATRGTDADPELAAILADARRELEDGLAELRALARGLHPTALGDGGLAAAVQDLADRYPIPVTVEISVGRLPGQVESTAYFIVSEALTNVLRHAEATTVSIAGHQDGDVLVLTIRDDGIGGVEEARGTGVSGLADRASTIGGSLRIDSPPGAGTLITARLPLT